MLNQYKLNICYENEGKLYASSNAKTGHYIIDITEKENSLSFHLSNSVKMDNIKFVLEFPYFFNEKEVVFCNGYQSWTDSREFNRNDVMPSQNAFARNTNFIHHSNNVGDYNFANYTNKKGLYHSWSYGYMRLDNTVKLFGSLKEKTGFTVIYFDYENNKIYIEKDLEGLTLRDKSEYDLMDLFYIEGEYDEVFDAYFKALGTTTPRSKRKVGYTSWYNYYQNISEDIITRDLEAISNIGTKLDIFQIDDGFQTAVGDWLSIDSTKFPNGMKAVVDKIHAKDMMAGLWLAPFGAQKGSKIAKNHRDWLIKDDKGYPIVSGINWGGFYSLDFYNNDARAYIKEVFDTVFNDWGFDMVKLDFLYGVCVAPRNNKTRGEIMCDAVDFIRECCGLKQILGCGVPLFPTFGKFDFCRTGCDVGLSWEKLKYFSTLNREGVSAMNSVINTIYRRHLDGRAFVNDPDVFLLRDSNMKMTLDQRRLLAKINKLFGSVLFVSDNVAEYNDEQKNIYLDTIKASDIKVNNVLQDGNIIIIDYIEDGVASMLKFDVTNGTEIK